ncbi:MAG TPA: sugar-transfer associated ATP-grasp domain-containing protein, partial [Bacteroidales bacterium]|nr:sugar-transfer associated ATP-grasp domain-containing protein [Bacteroidales bacterium]
MNRLKYFGYYLLKTDWPRFFRFLYFASKKTSKPKGVILLDVLQSSFRYNISLLDYFYFRFFELNKADRQKWAGTGFLYEYQLRMNPKSTREVLENKISFLQHYSPFIKRSFASLHELQKNPGKATQLLGNASGRLVLKGSHGQVGAEVEVVNAVDYNHESLLRYMQSKGYDLAEEYVVQHPAVMGLSPSGLNTLRIFTQLHNNKVDLLGARLRVSVNSPVDNLAAGNLAAPVDPVTGKVNGAGVYSDITKTDEAVHPITGNPMEGFQIPFWPEALQMAKDAAMF